MEARTDLPNFSAFIFELYERSHTHDSLTLLRWSVERLADAVGTDCNWSGWADLSQNEVDVCGSISHNLPDDFYHFWSQIKHDDLLARDVMKTGCDVATYNRQGSRHTEGMVALSDRYNIDKLSVIVLDHSASPISLFLSSYRSGREAKALGSVELSYLHAAMDHVRFAIERNALCSRGKEHLLVNQDGRVLASSPDALRILRECWPGWNGDRLPELMPTRAAGNSMVEGAIRFEKREAPQFSGPPLFYLTLRGSDPYGQLTTRERQIVDHIVDGLTHKEIARSLGISPATVRNHTQAVLTKLGARNKAALIKIIHAGLSA
jgi:DNA-binding CsgD family transcriptional regulator